MTIINALPFNLQNGNTADATQVDANFNEIVNDVNTNAAHNGVNTDITALTGLITPITPVQGGTNVFIGGTSTGTANAQVVASAVPSGFSLTAGDRIIFIAGATNTGTLTLNVNGAGATAVNKNSLSGVVTLHGGEVTAGNTVEAIFDGTQFIILTDASTPGFGVATTITAAATTDLGTVPSHNVTVAGGTGITAFGSSASTVFPVYRLRFTGTPTITYNATSMILPGATSITAAVGDTAVALYLGSGNWQIVSYQRANGQALAFSANFIQNYITGLIIVAIATNNAIAVGAGEATDSTNADVMLLNSSTTKTFASWAVGSGNGGLDTGTVAINTWYHIFVIKRVDTGVVDVLISLSATAPTMPTNYTEKRRIGSFATNASSQVGSGYTQTGDQFILATNVVDANNAAVTSVSRSTQTLTVPPGVVVSALFRATISIAHDTTAVLFTSLQESDQAAVAPGLADITTNVVAFTESGSFSRLTNTSAQIGVRSSFANATGLYINTFGWIDTRGRLG